MIQRLLPVLLAGLIFAAAPALAGDSYGDLKLLSKTGSFADVRADVEDAIVNRGYVVDYNGQVGDMLERTARDTGSGGSPYTDAQYFTFCSASLSARMMNADPRNLGYCPYVVFVYELKSAPGTVHVGYRKADRTGSDASEDAIEAINTMLEELVREAVK